MCKENAVSCGDALTVEQSVRAEAPKERLRAARSDCEQGERCLLRRCAHVGAKREGGCSEGGA